MTATPVQSSGSSKVTLSVSDGVMTVKTAFLITLTAEPPVPPTPSLTISSSGDGTVTPIVNNSKLVRGKTYTFTAKPGKNQVFAGWTGDIAIPLAQAQREVRSSDQFARELRPEPVRSCERQICGAFTETNGVHQNSAGGLYLMVNTRGMYSGRFQIGRDRYAFAGRLSMDLQGSNTVQRGVSPTVALQFRLGTNNESDQLFGQLNGNGWAANLTGDRAVYNIKTNPAPQAGVYTMILPSQSSGADAPQGR